jgi:hypothetical protein
MTQNEKFSGGRKLFDQSCKIDFSMKDFQAEVQEKPPKKASTTSNTEFSNIFLLGSFLLS